MTTHDFGDGFGAVDAHQHVNPDGSTGGWVSDDIHSAATVADSVWMGPDTQVCRGSVLTGNVRLTDNAFVLSGTLSDKVRVSGNAVVEGGVMSGDARAADSAFVGGAVADSGRVYESGVVQSGGQVLGNGRVHGSAVVHDAGTVQGSARLYGSAQISGPDS